MSPFTLFAKKGGDKDVGRSTKPPGLKMSLGKEACGRCEHFAGKRCTKYDYGVTSSQVCKSFSPKGQATEAKTPPGLQAPA